MLKPIVVIQKKDRFRLGYMPDRSERQRFIKEKRQNIPPLSSSFLSAGFINPEMIQGNKEEMMADVAKTFGSLSIDIIKVEDHEARGIRLPPFLWGQILDNWTTVELFVVFKLSNE